MTSRTAALVLLAALSLTLATEASARLGETTAQLSQRFGAPVNVSRGRMIFRKDGYTITAVGHNGLCCEITYQHRDGKLAPEAVKTLLASNGDGSAWRVVPPTTKDQNSRTSRWSAAGGRIEAVLRGDTLTVTDRTAMQAREKALADGAAAAAGRF
jgi:hypothetical protein